MVRTQSESAVWAFSPVCVCLGVLVYSLALGMLAQTHSVVPFFGRGEAHGKDTTKKRCLCSWPLGGLDSSERGRIPTQTEEFPAQGGGCAKTLVVQLLWMGEIRSHHLETMGSHCLLVFTGDSSFRGFLGGAGFRPSTVWLKTIREHMRLSFLRLPLSLAQNRAFDHSVLFDLGFPCFVKVPEMNLSFLAQSPQMSLECGN